MKQKLRKIEVGTAWGTNKYGELEVLELLPKQKLTVRFANTGTVTTTTQSQVRRGTVRDAYAPSVYGVGYAGEGVSTKDANGKSNTVYSIWRQMLSRCYNKDNPKYHRYGGRGYYVCEEWHNYQNYYEWYKENYIEGFQVDKDLTSPESKCYSPETCSFVPYHINTMLTSNVARRGKYPVGVAHYPSSKKNNLIVQICQKRDGIKTNKVLGYFSDVVEAFETYKEAKEEQIRKAAIECFERGEITGAVYNTLMNWQVIAYPN